MYTLKCLPRGIHVQGGERRLADETLRGNAKITNRPNHIGGFAFSSLPTMHRCPVARLAGNAHGEKSRD